MYPVMINCIMLMEAGLRETLCILKEVCVVNLLACRVVHGVQNIDFVNDRCFLSKPLASCLEKRKLNQGVV